MANEPLALANASQPAAAGAGDYQAFSEVLGASARGRAFLAEHARRSRSADTRMLLAALARIAALVQENAAPPPDRARAELLTLLVAIRGARPDIETSALPARAAKLVQLLDLLERRLAALAEPKPPPETDDAPPGARLAVVPPPEEPELPIPSPAAAPTPPLALAPAAPQPSSPMSSMPEIDWLASAPAAPARAEAPVAAEAESPVKLAIVNMIETRAAQPAARAPEPVAPADTAKMPAPSDAAPASPSDPLAAIMLLSEEERIALFT